MPRQTDIARTVLIVAIAVACIASVRTRAADAHAHAKETSDVNFLPPPEHVVSLSLGYRAAFADVLWAQVLVSQGLRMQERRRHDTITDLIDTINALDPEFREPYLWSDALVTLQAAEATIDDVHRTRTILERGMKNRPLDADLWRNAGQFIAFIAPASFLKDPKEQTEWKHDGARILARAAEMGGDKGYAGWSAISSAGILNRQGERTAAIQLLRRTLAVTDDDELREKIQNQLAAYVGEDKLDAYRQRQMSLLEITKNDLPFINKTTLHVLGPPLDAAYCAGGNHEKEPRCAVTWKSWGAAHEEPSTD